MSRSPLIILFYLAWPALLAQSLQRYEYAELHMGVQVRLTVYATSESSAESGCTKAFARIAQLEDVMSDYRPTSELMRLCDQPVGSPVKVSGDLFVVLKASQALAEKTDGAFDITVGPIVKLCARRNRNKCRRKVNFQRPVNRSAGRSSSSTGRITPPHCSRRT